jgi:HD-GYP domain-containing protein (c-di-GMP phosphodiesterase class II)
MSTTTARPVAALGPVIHGHVAVSFNVIRVLVPFGFDIYVSDGHLRPRLFRARESVLQVDGSAILRRQESQWFYIKDKDRTAYEAKLQANLGTILQSSDVPPVERFEVLMGAVNSQLRTAFQIIQIDTAVEESNNAGRHIAQLVSQSDLLPSELMAIAQHNNHTFAHILNTSSFAVCLAMSMDIRDPIELRHIAAGAMLHDLGKRFLPRRLLESAAQLSRADRQLMAEHPQKGYEELHDRSDVSFAQLMMVYQHHERTDGSGYPVGVLGRDIHPWARLCSIVDIFDALTGKRPYRKPMSVDAALAELDTMAGTRLDAEMVRCWKTVMSKPF